MKSFQNEQKVIFNTVKPYDNETKSYQVLSDDDLKLLSSWFSSCLSRFPGGDDWILFNLFLCVCFVAFACQMIFEYGIN